MTRKIKCVNPWKHQAQKVYMIDGLATTLSANGGARRQDWFVFGE